MTPGHEASRPLADRPLAERLLYTAFLLLMGVGYLMALVYLYTSHAGHDKNPACLSRTSSIPITATAAARGSRRPFADPWPATSRSRTATT